jgi:hypothetical protein
LEQMVRAWSYKPHHRLELLIHKNGTKKISYGEWGRLRYHAFVPNVLDPERKHIYVSLDHPIHEHEMLRGRTDPEYWAHVIEALILKMERHEQDEWLKFNGKHLRDPGHAHG